PDPNVTVCKVISRPFLIDQNFSYYDRNISGPLGPTIRTGRGLREEVQNQFASIAFWGGQVKLHTDLLTPFLGYHAFHYVIHPAVPRRSPADRLFVSAAFTVRFG